MQKIEAETAAPECPSGHGRAAVTDIEVTPEMVWAALEEWSGFDEARDELGALFTRVYRVMDGARTQAEHITRLDQTTCADRQSHQTKSDGLKKRWCPRGDLNSHSVAGNRF